MLDTLHKLQANGIRLAIATGRSPMTVPLKDFPGVQFDTLLTFNGSYCYDKEQVLYASPIPTEDIRTIRQNAAVLGRPMCLATEKRLAANGVDQDLADYFAVAKDTAPIAEDFDAVAEGTVYQIMIGGRAEEYDRLMQGVNGAKIAAWWDRALDIIPTAGGKAPASPMCWKLTALIRPMPWPSATATMIWKCSARWAPASPWAMAPPP